mmetsp:Transcript_8768/g.22645  ORF Transcript_8768/g.22645 Transcript_8768/m.22645 type:complete len:223 (-) Transcript_8768:1367-2035(-)
MRYATDGGVAKLAQLLEARETFEVVWMQLGNVEDSRCVSFGFGAPNSLVEQPLASSKLLEVVSILSRQAPRREMHVSAAVSPRGQSRSVLPKGVNVLLPLLHSDMQRLDHLLLVGQSSFAHFEQLKYIAIANVAGHGGERQADGVGSRRRIVRRRDGLGFIHGRRSEGGSVQRHELSLLLPNQVPICWLELPQHHINAASGRQPQSVARERQRVDKPSMSVE